MDHTSSRQGLQRNEGIGSNTDSIACLKKENGTHRQIAMTLDREEGSRQKRGEQHKHIEKYTN